MEYQRKKKQILSGVQYSNLLGFSLVENKLERNFKSIVQALLLAQTEGTQIKEDLHALSKSNTKDITALYDKVQQLESKVKELESKQAVDRNLKNTNQLEDNKLQERSLACISQPKLNINLINTPRGTLQNIVEPKPQQKHIDVQNGQYKQLKEKLDKLLEEQLDRQEVQKKLNSMRDNINLLKAEVKVLADKQSKSAKRVSLGAMQKAQIIQAIAQNQNQNQNSQKSINNIVVNPMNTINQIQNQLQKQINNLYIQVNTMKLSLEQMKELQGQNKRKSSKSQIQFQQLMKNHKKLQERVQSTNDIFEGQIKQLQNKIQNLQIKPQQQTQSNVKKSKKNIQVKQNISPNANKQINDRLSKLQGAIQGLVTQSEFKRFKTQTKDKISSLENEDQNIRKQLKQQIQMLTQILDAKQQQLKNIQREIDELKRKSNDISCNCQRKNNICISRFDQLKKGIQNLKEDLQFYKSMNDSSNQQRLVINNICQTTNQQDKKLNKVQPSSGKSSQQLKKYVNRKLHDQRSYLLGLIRDLQKKSGGKNIYEQDLVTVWDKLTQVNLFLSKKANEDDVKKSLAFYQKKLANIYQRINSSDQNTQDARIAKTNWFCLSCDKNLHNYQGKVGQHVVWDSMPIKPGYTKYYNKQQKKSLPTLKR